MPARRLDERAPESGDCRLRKHADYQRVYRESRKHFSASMTYFYSPRSSELAKVSGPRIGLTAGRVLGKAVQRNRIKRRMREVVRRHAATLPANMDIILHPRKLVLEIDFVRLDREVAKIFSTVHAAVVKDARQRTEAQV